MKAIVLIFILLSQGEPSSLEEHKLKEEVIEGEKRLKIEHEKEILYPTTDFFFPFYSFFEDEGYIYDPVFSDTLENITSIPLILSTPYINTPLIPSLSREDVITFIPEFQTKVEKWRLEILDKKGRLFKAIEGEGAPPKEIHWNGIGDENTLPIPDEVYSYVFRAFDELGNESKIYGEPFKMKGIIHKEGSIWRVSLSAGLVFKDQSSEIRNPVTHEVEEVLNLMRDNREKEIDIILFSKDELLRDEGIDNLRYFLEERILLRKGNFNISTELPPQGVNSSYVTIILK